MKHYPTQVELIKYHTKGTLEGMKTTEKMGFVSWGDACDWANGVTMSSNCPYDVIELRDLNTGIVENF